MTLKKDEVTATGTDAEDFLSRWSRRKRAQPEPMRTHGQTDEPEHPVSRAEEPPLTDADMPAVETLGPDSDFRGFLSPGISEGLRKSALRKLFHLPSFNIRDGLDDYDDDFTTFQALGDIVTADMRHQIEMKAKQAEERLLAEADHQEDVIVTAPDTAEGPQTDGTQPVDAATPGGHEQTRQDDESS